MYLRTPIEINHMRLHNRLVMPPMATAKAGSSGLATEALCAYYAEKAAGGFIGLIIAEHSFISPEGKAGPGQLSIADDGTIPGLKQLTATVHQSGSKIMAQLNHAGGAARREVTGHFSISASAVKPPRADKSAPIPAAMTEADIEKVITDFTHAAVRAKTAGFDGVEIHSAHGYLLNQFFSPLTNRRTDRYGSASLTGRIQLHLEVIAAIRAAVGSAYPVALRLGACDYMDGGSNVDDAVQAARAFEASGLDLLDISGGFCGFTRPGATEQGYFRELSTAVKKEVSIPIILTGGVVDAAAAEELLACRSADLIGVGRAILQDSSWAQRAMQEI